MFSTKIVYCSWVIVIIEMAIHIKGGGWQEMIHTYRIDGRCGPNHPLQNGAPAECKHKQCCNEYGKCETEEEEEATPDYKYEYDYHSDDEEDDNEDDDEEDVGDKICDSHTEFG
jgi:phosphopantothenoylcysteine synthetase/decarboxylase